MAKNILGFYIPEGQKLFFWSTGSGGALLLAKDEEEAMRKAIQERLNAGCTVEEAQRWHLKNDHIEEIVSDYTGPKYEGDLPYNANTWEEMY